MIKLSHKAKILVLLRSKQPYYVSSATIERLSEDWAVRPSTTGRRLRELYKEGKIQRKFINKIAWYRLTQSEPRKFESAEEANAFIQALDIKPIKQRSLL